MSETHKKNALAGETSPYLLQHAANPVDWHPWGEDALEKARREDRPILLSIGYSTCHWCHVMAHESFEDEHIARIMNRYFINIKVDREERPDLDKIYQFVHQLLNKRHGGWPLTVFLAPDDLTPFFGGTYFPDKPRHGMPAFPEILTAIAEAYRERRQDIRQQNQSVREAMQTLMSNTASQDPISLAPAEVAHLRIQQDFDPENGGLGEAPKFPHPTSLDYLLREYGLEGAAHADGEASGADAGADTGKKALAITGFSLERMANGGIRDQIGGGFFRYSVDGRWRIPHFEKMLYDNALLLGLYADAWQVTGNPLFQRVALETGDWIMGGMQSPEGGYYSALDADSAEDETGRRTGKLREGAFYVWSREEIKILLTGLEYRAAEVRFGLGQPPNFEGKWHLFIAAGAEELIGELGDALGDGTDAGEENPGRLLASIRRKLFTAREKRIRPLRDEKILTAWNALAIKGMASAGRILREPAFIRSAERALEFIREKIWQENRLSATYKDGRARFSAYLDDYVFLMDALLEMLQIRWRNEDLDLARALGEVVLSEFQDRKEGGFYFTADGHERLIHRPKAMMDEALPAGNGIAVRVFTRLGHLLGDTRYLAAAEGTLRAGWSALEQFPQAHTTLLSGIREYQLTPQIIILRGNGAPLDEWREIAQRDYAPRRLVLAIPAGVRGLPPALETRAAREEKIVAYLCEGTRCEEPITELDGFRKALGVCRT